MSSEMIGKIIGDYEITQLLGEGGMGMVFKGVHKALGQIVAIKMLHPNLIQNDHVKERFFREAKAMARLRHQNILTLYNFQDSAEGCFIIMEFVEGKTFEAILREKGPLPEKEAVKLFIPACAAMQYAHGHGIIHRDIKPANLMLLDSGIVKVLDFGTAKIVGGEALTQAGMTLGTVVYMSPEQLLGQELSPAADIYSLGVTLFELLTGQLPYYDENDMQLMRMILREQPKKPRDYKPEISEDVEAVIVKALSKKAEERYTTADDLRVALEQLVEAKAQAAAAPAPQAAPVEAAPAARPPTPAQVAVPAGGGLSPLLIVGLLLVVAGAVGGVLLLNQPGMNPAVGGGTLGGGVLLGTLLIVLGARRPQVAYAPPAEEAAPAPAAPAAAPAEEAAPEAPAPDADGKRPCPTCGRILLPTMQACPFCNPAGGDVGESTMVDYAEPPKPVTVPPPKPVQDPEKPPAGEARVVIIVGPNKGEKYKIEKKGLTIGRATDNDVVLRDLGVSGHHARIDFYNGSFYISDLRSSNGTFINNRRIDQSALGDNDVVVLGQSQLNIRIG